MCSRADWARRGGWCGWRAAKASKAARSTCWASCCTRPPTASPMPTRSVAPAAKAAPKPPHATLARELGLDVAHLQPIGWSATSVPTRRQPATPSCWPSWPAAPVLWRRAEQAAPVGPGRSRNALACSGACGRRIRVARSLLGLAPILCGACAQPFEPEDDEPG
jgi:hypothetical protein